jgi:hypothetical protein
LQAPNLLQNLNRDLYIWEIEDHDSVYHRIEKDYPGPNIHILFPHSPNRFLRESSRGSQVEARIGLAPTRGPK